MTRICLPVLDFVVALLAQDLDAVLSIFDARIGPTRMPLGKQIWARPMGGGADPCDNCCQLKQDHNKLKGVDLQVFWMVFWEALHPADGVGAPNDVKPEKQLFSFAVLLVTEFTQVRNISSSSVGESLKSPCSKS